MTETAVPNRQIRASYDDSTITVYQAYGPAIGRPAAANGRFGGGFRRERMTWIKPSFRWMMYRCGWALKPGQERPLDHRSIQIGLGGESVGRYCDEWIVGIEDVTGLARSVHATLNGTQGPSAAMELLPAERPYPVPDAIAARIGM